MADQIEEADGYRTELTYTIHYFEHLSPADIATAAQAGGVTPPDIDGPFTYLDMGCGRALGLLVWADAYPDCRFYGVDINPEHINECRARAEKAGLTNIEFFEASFDDPRLSDLPKMDFIVANGIYTWVSETIGNALIDRVAELLSDRGLFRMTYYTPSGYGQMLAVRGLMRELFRQTTGDVEQRSRGIVRFVQDVQKTEPRFFRENPEAAGLIKDLHTREPSYLAHEYLNEHWRLHSFAEVAHTLEAHGLHFCGDSRVPAFLGSQTAKTFREKVKVSRTLEELASFSSGERYRRDVYCRGTPYKVGREPVFTAADRFQLSRPFDLNNPEKTKKLSRAVIEIAKLCIARPVTFEEISQKPIMASLTPYGRASHLRNTMTAEIVARVSPGLPDEAPPRPARERLASKLAHDMLADDELAKKRIPMPSRLMGGAIDLPQGLGAALHTMNDGPEDEWPRRTLARLRHLFPKSSRSDPEAQSRMADQACRAVRSGPWGALLRRAGVLVPD